MRTGGLVRMRCSKEVLHSSATIKNEEKGEREGKKKKANEISYATATRSLSTQHRYV